MGEREIRQLVADGILRPVKRDEYDALLLDQGDVRDAIEHASAIIDAVERDLP